LHPNATPPSSPENRHHRASGRGWRPVVAEAEGKQDWSDIFREATWEEALEVAGGGLKKLKDQYGNKVLAGFGSAKGSNEEAYLFQKLVRTGFGSNNVDHCTRLCHASSVAALLLKEQGYRVIGLAGEGSVSLSEADLEGPLVIVTGSEGAGLSMLTRKHCDQLVRIPLRGSTPSLNASVATAMVLFEVARRGWMKQLSGNAPAPRIVRPAMPAPPAMPSPEPLAELAPDPQPGADPTPEVVPDASPQGQPHPEAPALVLGLEPHHAAGFSADIQL
jgi:tRNA(Leu) C34 or U34 (ribose-2'-O)-methylase TrmL